MTSLRQNDAFSFLPHFPAELSLTVMLCRPRAILDIIKSGENFRISTSTKMPEQGTCERCGYISSQVRLAILNSKPKAPISSFEIVIVIMRMFLTFLLILIPQKWCKACVLLEGLNRGLPKMGIVRSRGQNNERTKDMKQNKGTKNIESKQCGTLDF